MRHELSVLYTVLERGLEPPPPKGPAPKASVYTNFTTPALYREHALAHSIKIQRIVRPPGTASLVETYSFSSRCR